MKAYLSLLLFPFLSLSPVLRAEASPAINPELLRNAWNAHWVVAPGMPSFDYGVMHLRRAFDLPAAPERFVVHVSGDNRYQLFVNGRRVAKGPARGSLNYWRFETIDLAPWLRAGANVVAAVVWNHGEYAGESQVTWRTGFILQGDGAAESVLDTGPAWRAYRNQAYTPRHFTHGEMRGYYVVGPGDVVDGTRYPWGWEQPDFDDSAWAQAVSVTGDARSRGAPRMVRDAPNRWYLIPREVPPMEDRPIRLSAVRLAEGVTPPDGFPAKPAAFTIPARATARLLLDQAELTTGYPAIEVTRGAGARIRLAYAESLYNRGGRRGDKGDRNAVEGKEFIGNHDEFLSDGGANRVFRPLWWRTWRYLEVTVQTADEPLTIEDLRADFTAYTFEYKARFESGDRFHDDLLTVGWRTARLCAHDSYMDCPYYEQLQYAGDTRVQALISYYNAGDGRLARVAIAHLDESRTPEGATMSRAPTRQQQYIPGFSLWWIGMVHDYWLYQDDPEFVRSMLPGVRAVLQFFAGHQTDDGTLGPLPWWDYVDWTNEWPQGRPPRDAGGRAAPHDLQLILALDWAAELEESLGSAARANEHRANATRLRAAARNRYWAPARGLFADNGDHRLFSQQTNALAVLAGLTSGAEARAVLEKTLAEPDLTQASFYFRHYLNEALLRAGLGDRYLDLLDPWKRMLASGLTTWAERPENSTNASRSDCHAWSASPNVELFRTVMGIESTAPGYRAVRIQPHLGALRRLSAAVPHPLGGEIAVELDRAAGPLRAVVTLPAGVTGTFQWSGSEHPLRPGRQELRLP
jgi:hypothetical protein